MTYSSSYPSALSAERLIPGVMAGLATGTSPAPMTYSSSYPSALSAERAGPVSRAGFATGSPSVDDITYSSK